MSVLKSDDVDKVLKKKGFKTKSGKQKHIRYIFYADGAESSVRTHMSHNNQEITETLQSLMAEQLHITKTEFKEMIACSISYDDLIKRYKEKNLLKK